MTHSHIVDLVADALARPLPGPDAQATMAPRPRGGWPEGFRPEQARHAAGLLLLFPVADQPHLVLTVRSERVRHGGQVSLPGGVVERDESYAQAALREAHEEVSFASDTVRVLGALTPIDIPVSGFRLHPIVAAIDRRPDLRPSDEEVARILEIPIAALMAAASVEWRPMARGSLSLDVPAFIVGDVMIWGATAMVLAEFLTLVGWSPPARRRG